MISCGDGSPHPTHIKTVPAGFQAQRNLAGIFTPRFSGVIPIRRTADGNHSPSVPKELSSRT